MQGTLLSTLGRWLLLALCAGLALPELLAAEDASLLSRLKTAYIYNFTRYVDWPPRGAGAPFVIGVLGDPGMAAALRALELQGKRAAGGPIQIHVLSSPEAVADCQILYIGGEARAQLDGILAATSGKPILLVSDTVGFARRGVAINFFLKPDILGSGERLRFEINPAALKGRGLKVSAQLFDVAEVLP